MAGTRSQSDDDLTALVAYGFGVLCGAAGASLIWFAWTR